MKSVEIWPGQTGLWADGQRFLGKSPWQQSHPLKTALVGFSFHFSIRSFSIIVAKSLGIPTPVQRKVREGFLYFFKACWGDWEFSPGIWNYYEKRKGVFSTEVHHTSAISQTSIYWTANEYLGFSAHSITEGFKFSLTVSFLLSYEGDSIFLTWLHLLLPFLFHIPPLS